MLRDAFESPGDQSPADLRAAYDQRLAETIDTVGTETILNETELDEKTIEALTEGESPALTLEQATQILAMDDDLPDAESIAYEARDILLMGMSIAVLDVEALASGINDELEPKEIQQKIEGRYPISLDEYALIHQYIEQRKQ